MLIEEKKKIILLNNLKKNIELYGDGLSTTNVSQLIKQGLVFLYGDKSLTILNRLTNE